MHDHGPRPSPATPSGTDPATAAEGSEAQPGHSMWWMAVCCAPMVLIALALLLGAFGAR